MSADVLRQAATLMRDRAAAATPSPWVADRRMVVSDPGPNARYVADCYDEAEGDVDDQHIASWHPAVALAVADWLEQALHGLSVFGEPADDDPLWTKPFASSALAVARAYLGSDQ